MGYMNTDALYLITGANGFVGTALCAKMQADGRKIMGTARSHKNVPLAVNSVQLDLNSPDLDWSKVMTNVTTIIHLAARAHIIKENSSGALAEFRRTNVDATERLAQQAVAAGVKRFIFLSSIGVNGNVTYDHPFTETDKSDPKTPYAISKFEAEQVLLKIASKSEMEAVIIRSPLVYGPAIKANFLNLMKLVHSGIPLPFLNTCNRRSLIYVGNLIDAIMNTIDNPKASGNTYLVSDGDDVSTPELIRRIAAAFGKSARLIPFPPMLLRFAGKLTRQSSSVERLLGSLVVDSSKICRELGWSPPYTMTHGLKETADWYLKTAEKLK